MGRCAELGRMVPPNKCGGVQGHEQTEVGWHTWNGGGTRNRSEGHRYKFETKTIHTGERFMLHNWQATWYLLLGFLLLLLPAGWQQAGSIGVVGLLDIWALLDHTGRCCALFGWCWITSSSCRFYVCIFQYVAAHFPIAVISHKKHSMGEPSNHYACVICTS